MQVTLLCQSSFGSCSSPHQKTLPNETGSEQSEKGKEDKSLFLSRCEEGRMTSEESEQCLYSAVQCWYDVWRVLQEKLEVCVGLEVINLQSVKSSYNVDKVPLSRM